MGGMRDYKRTVRSAHASKPLGVPYTSKKAKK